MSSTSGSDTQQYKKPDESHCYKRPESCKPKPDNTATYFQEYRSMIYSKISIGFFLGLIILALMIYIIYLIAKIFYKYLKSFYEKHDKFLETKGVYKDKGRSYKDDDETYVDSKLTEKMKYYENMTYDSITREISQNIDDHTRDSKAHIERLSNYIKSTGHDIPVDKVDETALLSKYDDYDDE